MPDMRYSNLIQWITEDASSGGLRLQIDWDGGEAVVHIAVPSASQAAPGVAHGGFLATLADHVMGFVAAQQGGGAVATRRMTVDYLAPTPTSGPITIRARADSVSERTVTVSLAGSADDSGKVTFEAAGSYAVVSAARRPPGDTAVDYDTLEERFDPAQVFGWVTAALKDSFRPGVIASPVAVAVELSDATPERWTFRATAGSLDVAAGGPPRCDVYFSGTVRSWRELVYRAKSADQLTAAGTAVIQDPGGLLPTFLSAVTDRGPAGGSRDSP
jgi:acyl-coenzyme A thioesterase PaaI-like protein